MMLLALENISHAYGCHAVVRNLSLQLAKGEIGCLLGASGCGKTTVLRLIAGFESPHQGCIRLNGETVATSGQATPPEQRHIGMVFQDYALFPHLTIAENVGFGLRSSPTERQAARIDEMLDLVGLGGSGTKYPHELSGGQQQRIALARALAPHPHLLLLDEPFSNLDVELRERLSLEVRAILKAAGTAAILVTHDQHEAFAVADVIGIMHAGRIEQWDSPYNLYHRPATRYVADFIGHGAFIAGKVIDRETVAIELGTLKSQLPLECEDSCSTCTKVCGLDILLRPDDIVHDDNAVTQATVVAKFFRGAEFIYTLRLPSGTEVLSLVPSHHNHAIGEQIGIRLDVDHVVAFRQGT